MPTSSSVISFRYSIRSAGVEAVCHVHFCFGTVCKLYDDDSFCRDIDEVKNVAGVFPSMTERILDFHFLSPICTRLCL
jgi:hypothetical protein